MPPSKQNGNLSPPLLLPSSFWVKAYHDNRRGTYTLRYVFDSIGRVLIRDWSEIVLGAELGMDVCEMGDMGETFDEVQQYDQYECAQDRWLSAAEQVVARLETALANGHLEALIMSLEDGRLTRIHPIQWKMESSQGGSAIFVFTPSVDELGSVVVETGGQLHPTLFERKRFDRWYKKFCGLRLPNKSYRPRGSGNLAEDLAPLQRMRQRVEVHQLGIWEAARQVAIEGVMRRREKNGASERELERSDWESDTTRLYKRFREAFPSLAKSN